MLNNDETAAKAALDCRNNENGSPSLAKNDADEGYDDVHRRFGDMKSRATKLEKVGSEGRLDQAKRSERKAKSENAKKTRKSKSKSPARKPKSRALRASKTSTRKTCEPPSVGSPTTPQGNKEHISHNSMPDLNLERVGLSVVEITCKQSASCSGKDTLERLHRNRWDDMAGEAHAPESSMVHLGVHIIGSDQDDSPVITRRKAALEEADDIVDDPRETKNDLDDQASGKQPRFTRKKSLPSDPAMECRPPSSGQTSGKSPHDRFAPAFANSEMWTTDDDATVEKKSNGRFASSDCSLISVPEREEAQSVSEIDSTFSGLEEYSAHEMVSRTPTTTRRSGGRKSLPKFPCEMAEDDDIEDDTLINYPESFPEGIPLSIKKKSRRRSNESVDRKLSGNRNYGSSKTNTKHLPATSRKPRRASADFVPQTPSRELSSNQMFPISPSLTETPLSVSMLSRTRHHSQGSGVHEQPSDRKANKPLRLHVERTPAAFEHDEHTLGASTITTNFSTTQRTRGDTSVSTRSLFQSEQMNASETPQMPQRKRAGSEDSFALSPTPVLVDESHGDDVVCQATEPVVSKVDRFSPGPPTRKASMEGRNLLAPPEKISGCSEHSLESGPWEVDRGLGTGNLSELAHTVGPSSGVPSSLAEQSDLDGLLVEDLKPLDDTTIATKDMTERPELDDGQLSDLALSKVDSTKKRRIPKLRIFKRGKSWKEGAVRLLDDEP